MYYVYMLQCADGTLYIGITTDVARRVVEHNTSALGASYTRGRRPVTLLCAKEFADRSTASKEEYRLKHLTREEKLQWCNK
jgi:putative endonuclease